MDAAVYVLAVLSVLDGGMEIYMSNDKGRLVIISGFSGVGKGTVVRALLEKYGDYVLSISMTTRRPRPGEQEGIDYYYVSDEQFEEMINQDGFMEHAGYVGHYYGTPKKFILDSLEQGKNVILEIEVQGALQVKEKYPDSVMVFIIPPSADALKERLTGRGSETAEEINNRLKRAADESNQMTAYEYLVVNDTVDACVERIHKITAGSYEKTDEKEDIINKIQHEIRDFTSSL